MNLTCNGCNSKTFNIKQTVEGSFYYTQPVCANCDEPYEKLLSISMGNNNMLDKNQEMIKAQANNK